MPWRDIIRLAGIRMGIAAGDSADLDNEDFSCMVDLHAALSNALCSEAKRKDWAILRQAALLGWACDRIMNDDW